MAPAQPFSDWATFFKALADTNRLKIIGLLATQPRSVEEIAACLQITSATVSHHLQRLRAANLVEAHAQQYYSVYALREQAFRPMVELLSSTDAFKRAVAISGPDRYTTRVLDEYLVHGKLTSIPSQIKKRQVILLRLAAEFEDGRRYPEQRVDEILKDFHPDCAVLRRDLVDGGLLAHEGEIYWRVTPHA